MKQKSNLIGLDLIRFCAALLVMAHHLGFWIWAGSFAHFKDGGVDTTYHQLAPYTWFGWIGVEIFFVLSGFLIAYSAHGVRALPFARNRIVRLYPGAWVCSTLTALVLLATGTHLRQQHLIPTWLRSFFLVPAGPWVDGSYWTLGVEISFYTLIFLTLAAGIFRWIGPIIAAIGLVSSGISFYLWQLPSLPTSAQQAPSHFVWFLITNSTASVLLLHHGQFFAVGTLLWLCLFDRVTPFRLLAATACTLGGIVEILFHTREINHDTGFHFSPLLPTLIWFATLAAIIATVLERDRISAFFGRHGASTVRALALMTYPLYLLHQVIGYKLISLGQGHLPDLASLALATVLILLVAYLIATYLERPLQSAVRTRLGGSGRPPHLPAATVP